MSSWEEEQFESYLKSFQPLRAEPLPEGQVKSAKFRFPLAWTAAGALSVLIMMAGLHDWRGVNGRPALVTVAQEADPIPLTIGTFNALLTRTDSFSTSLNEVAWRDKRAPLHLGEQSALAVLGKEKL